ncbi:MAG: hypothetical protein AAGE03_02600 [Pseudomonadota bacterium]
MRIALALLMLLGSPALAVTEEWRDLYGRCERAILDDVPIDGRDLRQRPPPFLIDDAVNPLLGRFTVLDPLRTSLNIVPAGIWLHPDGRFEMRVLEFPTRPGTRAICEIIPARLAPDLTTREAAAILAAFRARDWARFDTIRAEPTRDIRRAAEPNGRGCPVVTSVTWEDGFFRSTISEGAGVPSCGGLSLYEGRRRLQTQGAEP